MKSRAFVVTLFCLLAGTGVFAQVSKTDIQQHLVGKRWALALFIEKYDNVSDTLLRVHDCANEFLEVFSNGTFQSSNLPRPGLWELSGDNSLVFRKGNGRSYKSVTVNYISADSMAITDSRNPRNIFIETFTVCKLGDSTFTDSRELFEVIDTWGIVTGMQHFRTPLAELGIGTATVGWNKLLYALSLNVEAAPWENLYGVSANAWIEDKIFTFGGSLTGFYDTERFTIGVRPMAGITGKTLFGNRGQGLHLIYSYNFLLGENRSDAINRHAIHLRVYTPFSRSKRTVRRIVTPD